MTVVERSSRSAEEFGPSWNNRRVPTPCFKKHFSFEKIYAAGSISSMVRKPLPSRSKLFRVCQNLLMLSDLGKKGEEEDTTYLWNLSVKPTMSSAVSAPYLSVAQPRNSSTVILPSPAVLTEWNMTS